MAANGDGRLAEAEGWTRVCGLDELKSDGVITASGSGRVAAVFWHEERAFAVDNRCPHMGFPLAQGTCKDGILTCEWHYARFDLETGGTFDPWADDVDAFATQIRGDEVWVNLDTAVQRDELYERWQNRLKEGVEQNIRLVCAKAVLAMSKLDSVEAARGTVSTAAGYALARGSRRNASGWGDGLSILTAMANIQGDLEASDRSLALYHGARRVAEDTSGQIIRVELSELAGNPSRPERLRAWFRDFIEVRNDEAAERVLRTAIAQEWRPELLIDLLASAGTDHYYRDFSHVMDTIAKAAELLDLIGWERSADMLPALVNQLALSTREEERNEWRSPEDLVALVESAAPELDNVVDVAETGSETWDDSLIESLLGDDAGRSLDAVMRAFASGTSLAGVSQALAYAAVLRLTRFPTSNEFGDWDTALHHFTYCASLAQVCRRAPSVELARGVLHGAMLVYQARFLNVPAVRLPGEKVLAAMPSDPQSLLGGVLAVFDAQGGEDEAGNLTYRYLTLGCDPAGLIKTLGNGVLREDPGFHDFQMLEEGLRLHKGLMEVGKTDAAFQTLVAIARWQAAHSPTRRATTQTYDIALRLSRGEAIHEADEATLEPQSVV